MDSLASAAARALASGNPLSALKSVALRNDPPALALRGIAMAQLGEYARARELLRGAARGFGMHEHLARARCMVAEAEVALAMRDVGQSQRALSAALDTLEERGDHANAVQARLVSARCKLLLGRLDEAAAALTPIDVRGLPPLVLAVVELTRAELGLRAMHTRAARLALDLAQKAAERAGASAMLAEIALCRTNLEHPAARLLGPGPEQVLRLDEVESLFDSNSLVVDACRRGLRASHRWVPMASRPVLFALARALGEAWPGDVDRRELIERVFRTRRPDETHRARLRVEMGRLRALLTGMAHVASTPRGFVLQPMGQRSVAVLAPPVEGEEASLLALLADGMAWSSSALAQALGVSQRKIQRTLAEMESTGQIHAVGQARARRWLAPPLTGITTILLLPAAMPFD